MSYGQDLLRQYLTRLYPHEMVENYRPDWLQGLEIDFWYPKQKIAIEFQGGQHYVPRNNDIAGVNRQKFNDRRKVKILRDNGILLIRIDAIHLGRSSLFGRIKAVCRHNKFASLPHNKLKCKGLDKLAKAYREILKEKYECPTAYRKGCSPRREVMQSRWDTARSAQTDLNR